MVTRTSSRALAGLAGVVATSGVVVATLASGAVALADPHPGTWVELAPAPAADRVEADAVRHTVRIVAPTDDSAEGDPWRDNLAAIGIGPADVEGLLAPRSGPGLASMSSPFEPGVPHVPADTILVIAEDGPRWLGREGSFFNGPADEVAARVDAWWAEQMAAGVTPEEADRKLARMGR
jgi:hypothetical protein